MAKTPLRVDFSKAPPSILKQLFGEAKNDVNIKDALAHFGGQAHEQEIFYYLNTTEAGDFVLVKNDKGADVPAISIANLKRQLAVMLATGQIKRLGERSLRYAALDYVGDAPVDDDADDEGEAEAA